MILLSAHRDTVNNNYNLEFKEGKYAGLLDNFIGRLVVDSLIVEEPNVVELSKSGEIKVFYGKGEEWGLNYDFPKIDQNDIVICVDVASGEQYKEYDFSIENISGFEANEINDLKESLSWEGFKVLVKEFDGNPDDEDEAWVWRRLGHKVISFIIPIHSASEETGWHVDDCSVSIEKVIKCKNGLRRTINYLL